MYADDTVLYFHHHDLLEIEKALSNDLDTLSTWLVDNELIINLMKGKTEIMVFGTKARLNKHDKEINLYHNSVKINVTNTYKYLGVQLDQSLSLNVHFNMVCKKVATRIRLLRKIRSFVTDTTALRIYQVFIMPLVTYCSLTNFYNHPSRRSTLANFENQIKRISKIDYVPSITKMCDKKSCITVFKSLNGAYPDYIDYFERISHNIGTRNNGLLLRVPRVKIEGTKKAFFYNGTILFNKLPIEVRCENDFMSFYKKLQQYFI